MIAKILDWLWSKKYGLILLAIFCLALFLRVFPRLGAVFGSDWVRFGEVDPWYHIRLLENLLHHFPQQIAFDPYSYFPYGQSVQFAPGFDLILGLICWVIGLGSPTTHTIEVVAAYFPAFLGALTVVPVFFIGKELFNKKVGLIAATLIMILPGNFLARSLLGLTDHHVAETFFSTTAALFLILTIKNSRGRIDFGAIRARNWEKLRKPVFYALLCGLFLGLYIICWMGSLLFILIIFVYLILQIMIDHLTGKSTDYLGILSIPIFVLALLIVIPFLGRGGLSTLHPVALVLATAALVLLAILAGFLRNRNLPKVYFPVVLIGIIVVGAGIVYAAAPHLFTSMVDYFDIFLPQGRAMTISEAQPLFYGFHSLIQNRAWGFFTTGFFITPITLILLGYSAVKEFKAEKLFLLTWSVLMLSTMLVQSRFSYYFAVNVAILGGYFGWRIFGWISGWISAGLKTLGFVDRPPAVPPSIVSKKKAKEKKRKRVSLTDRYFGPKYIAAALSALIGFFLVIYPNISPALGVAGVETGPNVDWHDSLIWLKDNTPDPFQDPDYFNRLYATPSGEKFNYPPSTYGVMSAWDYGHWITEIAHRIPNSNPHQSGAYDSAVFFTAQDESQADAILQRLGSRYVIIDKDMALDTFLNNTAWTGENITRYKETYYQVNNEGKLAPVDVYYPEYYQSMSSRLYYFLGQEVVPESVLTISYEDRTDLKGNGYKRIIGTKTFSSFEQAESYCQQTPNTRIAGTDPFVSPVPLAKLDHYKLIHSSQTLIDLQENRKKAYVEIFEYQP